MTTMSDFMNDVLASATLEEVDASEFANRNSRGGKVYLATKLAIKAFVRECTNWGFNELIATASLAEENNTITLPTTLNPNYIHEVWISGGSLSKQTRLKRSTYLRYAKDVLTQKDDPTETSTPTKWYMVDRTLYVDPYANDDYTIHFYGQRLPQSWEAEDSRTTELDLPEDLEDVLHEMALWRLLRIERGGEFKEIKKDVEDMKNKDSLLYKAIHANKLPEKRKLRRVRISKTLRLGRHI